MENSYQDTASFAAKQHYKNEVNCNIAKGAYMAGIRLLALKIKNEFTKIDSIPSVDILSRIQIIVDNAFAESQLSEWYYAE